VSDFEPPPSENIELWINGERRPWSEWNRSMVCDRVAFSDDDTRVEYHYTVLTD
jgi:hypothetical protein